MFPGDIKLRICKLHLKRLTDPFAIFQRPFACFKKGMSKHSPERILD